MIGVIDLSQIPTGPLPLQMQHSDATALHLLLIDSGLYTSFIRFPPFGSVPNHSHPGGHILLVRAGSGTLTKNDSDVSLSEGTLYLIKPGEPHSIEASSEGLDLLVFGDNYFPEDSKERLSLKG